MSRAVSLLALIPIFAPGCIIYEERYHGDKCRPDCPSTTDTLTTPQQTTPVTGPQLTDATSLTVDQGYPGQQLLTEMLSTGAGALDLSTLSSVAFERDVDVVDTIVHPNDVVLLLDIAADAAPGDVTVEFTTSSGEYVIAEPFHILPPPSTTEGGSGTTATGSSGTSGTTAVSSTSDTGGV